MAAKVSRCGHVFCWACIMHHLSYTKGAGMMWDCDVCGICGFVWCGERDGEGELMEVR